MSEPRLPVAGLSQQAPDQLRTVTLPKKRGRHLMVNMWCPRCGTRGSVYKVPEKLRMELGNLDLPYFLCASCGNRFYDYAEMLAYIMARMKSESAQKKEE